ncbi:MAG TPA: FAD-dependent oxidoreductase [Thermoleophilia bacterium]|nr:FAD-dependent oxidoreductase [Thermoleophilia bacterium]
MNAGRADVAVMGGGVAGLAAALAAREAGASVVLCEKGRALGGTSNYIQGVFAAGSEMQKQQYIAYSCDQAFRNFVEYNHWRGNARLARNLIDRSADTITWCQAQGAEFTEVTINMPDAPRTYHALKGAGRALVKALAQGARERGVDIRVGSRVVDLLTGQDGAPYVVRAKVPGGCQDFECRAVVIASGGYANNRRWIKKYTGFDLGQNLMPVGNSGKMGDGIRLAWKMGAGAEGVGVLHLIRVAPWGREFPFMSSVEAACIQPVLWVDARGERFCDEGIAFCDTSTGNVNARLKCGYSWSVFDDGIKRHFVEKGLDRGMTQRFLPGHRLQDLDEVLKRLLASQSPGLVSADSVEGLAAKMQVDPDALSATIAQYNEACARGRDEMFAKNPLYLRPLHGPTYYAARARTVFLGTLGGIRVSPQLEAVDDFDTPIPGLFAAGNDVGGLHAESYSMWDTSGIASAFALGSGRIAGENAAAFAAAVNDAAAHAAAKEEG